jgi:hypothetical protein
MLGPKHHPSITATMRSRLAAVVLLLLLLQQPRRAAAQQRGDNFVVPAPPGGCRATAQFLGCFKDDKWSPDNYGAKGAKMPAGEHAFRAVPYALPGCYDCHTGAEAHTTPNPCKFAPDPPPCDVSKMSDDYCATLCLQWAAAGHIPGSDGTRVWSATQFSYTCWCGAAEDGAETGGWAEANRVDDKQCNTPCKGAADQMCGGNSLNHVMLVECSAWGWELVVAAGLLAAGYLVGGALYMHRSKGVALSRDNLLAGSLLPNRPFWEELRSLVADGVHFAKARSGGGGGGADGGGQVRAGYAAVGEAAGGDSARRRGHGDDDDDSGRSRGGRDKAERSSGSKRSSGGGKESASRSREEKKSKSSKSSSSESGGKQPKAGSSSSSSKGKKSSGGGNADGDAGAGAAPQTEAEEAAERELREQHDVEQGLHQSQAKIKVVGING